MSTSTTHDRVEEVFKAWADSNKNTNRARLSSDKYAEYISILTAPNAKPPHIEDKLERQKWSNSRAHAIANYDLIDGTLWRKAVGTYLQR
jgi:hypothetical protein